jgi:hypothetical protein
MSSVTIPKEIVSVLTQLKEATELHDAQGNCIGIFKPLQIDDERLEKLKSLFDLEEAERIAAAERQGYSWEEVKEHLRTLGKQG